MKKTLNNILLGFALVAVLGALALVLRARMGCSPAGDGAETTPRPAPTAESAPTPVPTPTPDPEYFTISAVGDCTLASSQNFLESP